MHSQFPGRPALVSFVLLQDGENEFLLEFTNGFRIKDVALVHLHDQGFKLISHGVSLSREVSPS